MAGECYVYIMSNRCSGVLYTGATNALLKRVRQHRSGHGSAFAARYNLHKLVWCEIHTDIEQAIIRQKRIKRWRRVWKIELIEGLNPQWRDLAAVL